MDGDDRSAVCVRVLGRLARSADRADVEALQRARDEGVQRPEELARRIWRISRSVSSSQPVTCRRISEYYLGDDERAALETFYGTRSKPASLREQARYGFTDNARRILECGIWN